MRYLLTALILSVVVFSTMEAHAGNWPNWRGPTVNGVAGEGNPPISFSETENIKWKIKFPGSGSSTPIVWGDKMIFQTAVPTAEAPKVEATPAPAERGRRGRGHPGNSAATSPIKFNLVCLNRHTGEILWEKTAHEAIPHEGHHPSSGYASYSPVTDGEFIWASFGSWGVHCYDMDGNHIWSKDTFPMSKRMAFGEGSSAALAGDKIFVQMDHEGASKLLAFDKTNGDLVWERDRDERTSWVTPFVVEVGDTTEVVTLATKSIRSYDAENGDLIWESGGMTLNTIPMPVTGFGHIYCTSGFRGFSLMAIKLGQKGDLKGTDAISWELDQGTPYVASPLLYNGKIYVTESLKAVLSCYDAKTGTPVFTDQKLEGLGQLYASPVAVAGRIYIPDRRGKVLVIKESDTYEVLATNTLDEGFDASPVVIGDDLYLKGHEHLYCISKS
jgi:outer membrane protein assembly factor BamB